MNKKHTGLLASTLSGSQQDLKKKSLRGGAVTLSSQGLSFIINIGSTMILARLLTPQDYGLISMVAAITGFAAIFSNLGLSTATIQRSDITHAQVSTLFWINAGLGTFITLIVAALAPAVAWFYESPQLLWVTLALSLNFFITGFGVQHQAILNRQMRFYDIAKIQILARLLGVAAAVLMAMHGFRYWALVANTLTASLTGVLLVWLLARWYPGLPQRKSGVRSLLRFGSDIAGFNIINYFSRNMDNILIGKYYGGGVLGLYSKAYQLLMLPIANLREPLTKVALPSLSKLQHEPAQYRSYYVKFVSLLAFLSMPLVVYMFVCAENIISLVLGQQWLEASVLFKILAFVALLQPVGSTRGMVLLSLGQSRKFLLLGAASSVVTISAFLLGLPWGAKGVAIAYAISNNILLWIALHFAFKDTPVSVADFFSAVYKPLAASVVVGCGCFILQRSMDGMGDVLVLIVCLALFLPTYLLCFSIFSGGTNVLREYFSYSQLAFSRK